jgi:ribosomal protein L37AE/L43A
MPRSRKINLKRVQASLNKTCPKCGFTITPDLVKRVDFERMECPKCGEKFRPNANEWEVSFPSAVFPAQPPE